MPVLVLGMHRSGTSVLTRVVSLLGFEVGDDDILMGASEWNVTGHWEVTDLTLLNDDLLRHLGGRWSAPPDVADDELARVARGEWGDRARQAVAETFAGNSWVWKDPRLCILLPFWRAVLDDADLVTVLVLREPGEVARSLAARDGIGLDYGVALWERYQRAALAAAAGLPALVVRYSDLLSDPVRVTESLDRFLPHDRPRAADPAAAAATVDTDQRHHRVPDRRGLPAGVQATLDASEALVGEHHPLRPVTLDPETPNLQLAFDEHARMSTYHDLVLQYAPVVEEVQDLRDRVARLQAHVESLESKWVVRALRALTRRPRPPLDP
jgi:hypothetical protein